MKVPRFLAEVSLRSRAKGPDRLVVEPVGALIYRVCGTLDGNEGKILAKACLAVIECVGEMTETELNVLSRDSIVLLDRFAAERLRLRYDRHELDLVAVMLRDLLASRESAAAPCARPRGAIGLPGSALKVALALWFGVVISADPS